MAEERQLTPDEEEEANRLLVEIEREAGAPLMGLELRGPLVIPKFADTAGPDEAGLGPVTVTVLQAIRDWLRR